jgi:hypothetical protein
VVGIWLECGRQWEAVEGGCVDSCDSGKCGAATMLPLTLHIFRAQNTRWTFAEPVRYPLASAPVCTHSNLYAQQQQRVRSSARQWMAPSKAILVSLIGTLVSSGCFSMNVGRCKAIRKGRCAPPQLHMLPIRLFGQQLVTHADGQPYSTSRPPTMSASR